MKYTRRSREWWNAEISSYVDSRFLYAPARLRGGATRLNGYCCNIWYSAKSSLRSPRNPDVIPFPLTIEQTTFARFSSILTSVGPAGEYSGIEDVQGIPEIGLANFGGLYETLTMKQLSCNTSENFSPISEIFEDRQLLFSVLEAIILWVSFWI